MRCLLFYMLAVAVTAVVVCGSRCEDPHTTNPDFVLLMGQDGVFPTDPKPSPDGRLLYYVVLVDTTYQASPRGIVGDIRVRCMTDSTDRLLLAGEYGKLSLSRDGRTIAPKVRRVDIITTLLLVLDTSGAVRDTVYATYPANWYVSDHALSSDGNVLYYLSRNEPGGAACLYSVDLQQGGGPRLVQSFSYYMNGFDLFDGDSIYADSSAKENPAVNPVHTRWAVSAGGDRFTWYWKLHDRYTGKSVPWGSETRPYVGCPFLGSPVWSADGRDFFFVVGRKITETQYSRTEVWVLKDAAEFLPQD